jgi:hypothetical protein
MPFLISPDVSILRNRQELIGSEMVKYVGIAHIFLKGRTMKSLRNTSKVLLVVAALSLTFAGCERRASDQSSGASGSSGTMGSSGSSGSSGTSGSSGSSGSSGMGSSGSSGSSGSGGSGAK